MLRDRIQLVKFRRLWVALSLLFLACMGTPAAFAQANGSSGQFEIEANTVFGESDRLSLFLFILVLAILAISLWSSLGRLPGGPKLKRRPTARNLFLRMCFQVRPDAALADPAVRHVEHIGYLRSLDLRRAVFVSPIFLAKGEKVELCLDSLPGYPNNPDDAVDHTANAAHIAAEVVTAQHAGGQPPSYIVAVKFVPLQQGARLPLIAYLENLAGQPGSLSHA